MGLFNNVATSNPTTLWNKPSTMLMLLFVTLEFATARHSHQDPVGFCDSSFPHLDKLFPAHEIKFPVDHFHNESRYEPHSDKFFNNRYWFNDTYYQPGGPIIVQNAGEITGNWNLHHLQIGLLHEQAKATNGIAVVLEHRYYGHSLPVLVRNADAFRFLTVEQAMADQAYFAQNIVFPGKEHLNLTAPNTPWFAIGCSYPGALTAFERIQYPDLFWGAIASSAITAPTINNWEYFNAVREYSPEECVVNMGKLINIFHNIIAAENELQINQLKKFFGNPTNISNTDFVIGLSFGYYLQSVSWLPCLNREANPPFCREVAASKVLFPEALQYENTAKDIIANGGWANETHSLIIPLLNYLGNVRLFHRGKPNRRRDESSDGETMGTGQDLKLLAYNWQLCTELGSFITGDQPPWPLPVVPSQITLEYAQKTCREGLNVTGDAKIGRLLKYGGLNISYPRLMLVGGEADPWRPSTALATRYDVPTRLNYSSTPDQPWYVVPVGTHCCDWPGVFESQRKPGIPPESIKHVHEMEKDAFKRWLKEWHNAHPDYDPYVRPNA